MPFVTGMLMLEWIRECTSVNVLLFLPATITLRRSALNIVWLWLTSCKVEDDEGANAVTREFWNDSTPMAGGHITCRPRFAHSLCSYGTWMRRTTCAAASISSYANARHVWSKLKFHRALTRETCASYYELRYFSSNQLIYTLSGKAAFHALGVHNDD